MENLFCLTRLEKGELVLTSVGFDKGIFVGTEIVDMLRKVIKKFLQNMSLNSGVHNNEGFHSAVKENIVKPTWRVTCLLEIQLFRSLLGPSSGINESAVVWTINFI